MMFICGKGKDDYLTIATTPPQKQDPMFKTWRLENNMAMFWLINTIDNEVKQNFTLWESKGYLGCCKGSLFWQQKHY